MADSSRGLVAYVGPFSFPNGGAAARRILGNVKSLQVAGFDVVVASGQGGRRGASSEEVYDGVRVVSLNERTSEHLPRAVKHLLYFGIGRETVQWLDSLEPAPTAVVLYSGYSPYLLRLIRWSRRRGIALVFDAVEWYDPPSPVGWASPYQLNIELAMRLLVPAAGRVIAISQFLSRYYLKRGCQTVLVPPTLETARVPARFEGKRLGSLTCVYAGTPGRKDLLNTVIEAVLRMREAGFAVRLLVAGVEAVAGASFKSVANRSSTEVLEGVAFLGLLDHATSMDLVRNADFSLLLRRDARYSRAGFPTKFVESFAVGTPVIANITSDLGSYLLDGSTGVVCRGYEASDMQIALMQAFNMCPDSHVEMRKKARGVAERAFDVHAYSETLSTLVLPSEA